MAGTYNTVNLPGAAEAKTYSTLGTFPAGQTVGELGIAEDTNTLYYWDGSAWVELSGGGGGGTGDYKPEAPITLTGTDITNGYITLTEAPTDRNKTRLVVIGGPSQEYAIDFLITNDDSGRRLSWSGLGLDGVLTNGDTLLVTYN